MKKPKDYDVYFNPDGTERENPYEATLWEGDNFAKNFIKARDWATRFFEIKISLMPEEEGKRYRESLERFQERMRS
jgi:hypothetical protein